MSGEVRNGTMAALISAVANGFGSAVVAGSGNENYGSWS